MKPTGTISGRPLSNTTSSNTFAKYNNDPPHSPIVRIYHHGHFRPGLAAPLRMFGYGYAALSSLFAHGQPSSAGQSANTTTVPFTVPSPHKCLPLDPQPMKLSRVSIDAHSSWPPRAAMTDIQVLVLNSSSQFFTTQIPVTVNGIILLALIDTGAAITVSSRSITTLLGIFKMNPSNISSAIGMAGIPVAFIGCFPLTIQIGSITLTHNVHFTDGPCTPRQVDQYNIILGNDFLSRLPSWQINYPRRLFLVGNDFIRIRTDSSLCEYNNQGIRIRAAETSVIPPRSEKLVACFLPYSVSSPLMMITQPADLVAKNLVISPAVISPQNPYVLVTNPSSRPEILFAKQQLGIAAPLSVEDSGSLSEGTDVHLAGPPIPLFTTSVDDIDVELPTDSFLPKIDLSQCERSTVPHPGGNHFQIVVPETLKELLFLAFHSSPSAGGHFHWRKTLSKIARRYFWPRMAEDIFTLCRSCEICQRKRAASMNQELLLSPVPTAIFDKVYVDLTGPLHTSISGNKYILALIDHFSKYVIAVPLPNCSSISVAQAIMNECILKYGVMTELISDNASYLRSETIAELGKLLRISHYYCTPYHHEGNGACERVFATFQLMWRAYVKTDQTDWDNYVAPCTFTYNTSTHSSTNNTPFFLMFGRDPSFNVDLVIRHHEERHVPQEDNDGSEYLEHLLKVLHSAWSAAYAFNTKRRAQYKKQSSSVRPFAKEVYATDSMDVDNDQPSSSATVPVLATEVMDTTDSGTKGNLFLPPTESHPLDLSLPKAVPFSHFSSSVQGTNPNLDFSEVALPKTPERAADLPGPTEQGSSLLAPSSTQPTTLSSRQSAVTETPSSSSIVASPSAPTAEREIVDDSMDNTSSLPREPAGSSAPAPASALPPADAKVFIASEAARLLREKRQRRRRPRHSPLSDAPGSSRQCACSVPAPVHDPAPPRHPRITLRASSRRAAHQHVQTNQKWTNWNNDMPDTTPEDFHHPLMHLHPWGDLVRPRPPRYANLSNDCVTSNLAPDNYRPLRSSGYYAARFVRSLFPVYIKDPPSRSCKIPVMELQTLEAAIAFRDESRRIIQATLDGSYVEEEIRNPQHPTTPSYVTAPLPFQNKLPVLYQVVATGHASGVVLEAKDFFVVGPDRRDLHCIILDHFSVDIVTSLYGINRDEVSVGDLVWVYDVLPTRSAYRNPERVLHLSRIPKAIAYDAGTPCFFKAHHFALITPAERPDIGLGMVVNLIERGGQIKKIQAVFEGASDAVTISPLLCEPDMDPLVEHSVIRARMRQPVSLAIRFSEPPASKEARDELCNLAQQFLPIYTREGVVPLRVLNLRPEDREWLDDRISDFSSYVAHPHSSRRKMTQLFNVACSTLVAMASLQDDSTLRWVTATVPSLHACPFRLDIILSNMPSEAGWRRDRLVDFWVEGASQTTRMRIEHSVYNSATKQLSVRLAAHTWNHRSVVRFAQNQIQARDTPGSVYGYARLSQAAGTNDNGYGTVVHMPHLVDNIPSSSVGSLILDTVYGNPHLLRRRIPPLPPAIAHPASFRFRDRYLPLTTDQRAALELGVAGHPIVAIQAAYGTGKTVLGAIITGLLVCNQRGPIIITATTNHAVGHFTTTLLAMRAFQHLTVLRYVSDTAFMEGIPSTPVDIHEVLKNLIHTHKDALTGDERQACTRFSHGRQIYEDHIRNPERSLHLSEKDREEFLFADKEVSRTLSSTIRAMFRVRSPDVLLMTTTSLIASVQSHGIFHNYLADRKVIIVDEASQLPESLFAALVTQFPDACQVYMGDVHQMQPYVDCRRSALPAIYGARSIMSVLMQSPFVPRASLVTTFRAHPALNTLHNAVTYGGELVSGTPANHRSRLLDQVRCPNRMVPFIMVDITGSSVRTATGSHHNEQELQVCMHLVLQLFQCGFVPEQLCVLTFYKEPSRRLEDFAQRHRIEVATVDSIQGREVDVVIVLTTRTNIREESAEFIDDHLRINVALTRCRHGQFVLGHVASLRHLPHWSTVIQWAMHHRTIIPVSRVNDLFRR
ncbi:unnamed protein product [Heligmosomoides polygyrus]|uniref:Integrase catalytic domain-containing protein n=1 Tax=Heligmosomoides polygyrus TaxID=6339 RepID=A0A183GJG0_HELPZ|nr:unnamed protein product [Heligmosomoides polygyrus]